MHKLCTIHFLTKQIEFILATEFFQPWHRSLLVVSAFWLISMQSDSGCQLLVSFMGKFSLTRWSSMKTMTMLTSNSAMMHITSQSVMANTFLTTFTHSCWQDCTTQLTNNVYEHNNTFTLLNHPDNAKRQTTAMLRCAFMTNRPSSELDHMANMSNPWWIKALWRRWTPCKRQWYSINDQS